MALLWKSIRVELVSGHGQTFDPPPGRILIIPPRTTFETLATAIDDAFARWDRAHLQMFTLADGTMVSDRETLEEGDYAFDPDQPIPRTVEITASVARRIKTGDRFTYVFDLGDNWTHLCTVEGAVDPYEVLGVHVVTPTPFWGWGAIPDQYGRRWADDSGDPDEQPPVRDDLDVADLNPAAMQAKAEYLSGRELRVAVAAGPKALIEALTGKDLSEILQQAGAALLDLNSATSRNRSLLEEPMFAILQRLEARRWQGDELLAEALLAVLQRRVAKTGTPTPIDITHLADLLHDSLSEEGIDVDVTTGDMIPAGLEFDRVADDEKENDDERPTVRIFADRGDWGDLDAFAGAVEDESIRNELLEAIEGRGAFSRFRRVIERHDELLDRWLTFRDDRRIARARVTLELAGYRSRN